MAFVTEGASWDERRFGGYNNFAFSNLTIKSLALTHHFKELVSIIDTFEKYDV